MTQQPPQGPWVLPIADQVDSTILSAFRLGRGSAKVQDGPDPDLPFEDITEGAKLSEIVRALIHRLAYQAEECVIDGDNPQLANPARDAVHLGNWLGLTWCQLNSTCTEGTHTPGGDVEEAVDVLADLVFDIDTYGIYELSPAGLQRSAEDLHLTLCERHDIDPHDDEGAVLRSFIADGMAAYAIGLAYERGVLAI